MSCHELCAEGRALLDSADASVLSDLLRAQVLATLALVELVDLIHEELRKGKVPAKDVRPGDWVEMGGPGVACNLAWLESVLVCTRLKEEVAWQH